MDNIRSIRVALGLTQTEFAERLGLHQSTISRFETGELETDKRTLLAAQSLLASTKVTPAPDDPDEPEDATPSAEAA